MNIQTNKHAEKQTHGWRNIQTDRVKDKDINTYLFHSFKSFKHKLLFYSYLFMSCEHIFLTAQTDLSVNSRTFCLKINKLQTFSEIIQA